MIDDDHVIRAYNVHIVEKQPSSVLKETFEFNTKTYPDKISIIAPASTPAAGTKRPGPTAPGPSKRSRTITDDDSDEAPTSRVTLRDILPAQDKQPATVPKPSVIVPPNLQSSSQPAVHRPRTQPIVIIPKM